MSDKPNELDVVSKGMYGEEGRKDRGIQFVIVAITATRQNRYVEAISYLNGTEIGKISAADNTAPNVISSPHQMMTLPVPVGFSWQIKWNVANHNGEVKVWLVS